MVPLIVSFFAGFIVNRLMNHQDVITGDVTEGLAGWVIGLLKVLVLIIGGLGFLVGCGMSSGHNEYVGDLLIWGGLGIMSFYFVFEGLFDLKNSTGQISSDGWNKFKGGLVAIGVCSLLCLRVWVNGNDNGNDTDIMAKYKISTK
tara:strand:- start:359 stop:793 length:435 start_codon:yes stop_codon:yes gene_type:complete